MHMKQWIAGILTVGLVFTPLNVSAASVNKYFNKTTIYTFSDSNGIKKITVNGKTKSVTSGVKSKKIKFSSQGKYVVKVVNKKNNTKTYVITIDKTDPVITGVTNKKTYTKNVTVKISDNYGISSIKENGKSLKASNSFKKTYSKDGDYTVTAKDKAGNTKTIKFSINKKGSFQMPSVPFEEPDILIEETPAPTNTVTNTPAPTNTVTNTPAPTDSITYCTHCSSYFKTVEPTMSEYSYNIGYTVRYCPDCDKILMKCPACNGMGNLGNSSVRCTKCNGTGLVEDTCENCDGKGYTVSMTGHQYTCDKCNGKPYQSLSNLKIKDWDATFDMYHLTVILNKYTGAPENLKFYSTARLKVGNASLSFSVQLKKNNNCTGTPEYYCTKCGTLSYEECKGENDHQHIMSYQEGYYEEKSCTGTLIPYSNTYTSISHITTCPDCGNSVRCAALGYYKHYTCGHISETTCSSGTVSCKCQNCGNCFSIPNPIPKINIPETCSHTITTWVAGHNVLSFCDGTIKKIPIGIKIVD